MKKIAWIILSIILCVSFAGCSDKFEREHTALVGTKWFSATDTSNSVVVWNFYDDSLQRAKYYFDGNGIHDSDMDTAEYEFQRDVIKVTFDDKEVLIPYTFENELIRLEQGKYFSVQDIEEGIQGCWTLHKKDYIIGMLSENEYNIQFNAGTMTNESAAVAYTGDGYFYYGPEEGPYTIGNGKFETEVMHGGEYFFNVYGGTVNVFHYGDKMSPSDGLPGEDGYVFD